MSVMVKNKTNKNYKRSQKGRSMVEMLGVLAIIGVLSVGGVYGYGVAMKKHKANELLHQASMLATTISAQIQSKGQLPTTIEDFGNGKYGTFNPPSEANAEQFKMEITGMDPAVCEQMEKMSGGMVRKAECDDTTLTLTYNNNLSSDKVAADYNEDTTGEKCKDAGYHWCDGLCQSSCCNGEVMCGNTCCASGATCGSNNTCCVGDYCAKEGEQVYCIWTWNNGECGEYGSCAYANSGRLIEGLEYNDIGIDGKHENGWCANDENEEIYCLRTNENGKCFVYDGCSGEHSGMGIIGTASGYGTCAPSGYEIVCSHTDSKGECEVYGYCSKGSLHSGMDIIGCSDCWGVCEDWSGGKGSVCCEETDSNGKCIAYTDSTAGQHTGGDIIGTPNAKGLCNVSGYIYCQETDAEGRCVEYLECEIDNHSGLAIVGIPNADGACAFAMDQEIYCLHYNEAGDCDSYDNCVGTLIYENGLAECDWSF